MPLIPSGDFYDITSPLAPPGIQSSFDGFCPLNNYYNLRKSIESLCANSIENIPIQMTHELGNLVLLTHT
ncbi:hypothetical protein PanWU01x14_292230 [Parasponia andersonii]|uniref:Uncharacterized protein n=1 Tax=Parasponia andersonii TaxID=3476 RepID=A0A2P5AXB1_PARAD|nr:hypothetical protein PanWU01x14_292230 [Parasponia andersonii]